MRNYLARFQKWAGKQVGWVQGSFPLVRQATHKTAIQKVQDERARFVANMRATHERELAQEREAINNLLPKLIRITVERRGGGHDDMFRRYQIVTQFSEEMVYRCLRHGNSQREIEYMADYLAHQFKREMLTINFERLRDADERARQKDARYNPFGYSGDAPDFPPPYR